jgi:hypothetical protein
MQDELKKLYKSDDENSLEDPELPAEIYVGYESETLKVKLDVCEGNLRKIVQDVAVFQRGLFPLRFYRYSR